MVPVFPPSLRATLTTTSRVSHFTAFFPFPMLSVYNTQVRKSASLTNIPSLSFSSLSPLLHTTVYEGHPEDAPHGINKAGTLGGNEPVGVHSLQDVPIFASGPGSELIAGVQGNTEVFHKIAEVLGLGDQR